MCASLPTPAAYGAEDLSQANTVYLDSHWGLGASVRELVQGIDCPMTAAFMDAVTLFKGSGTVNVHKNAICVFEHNPGEEQRERARAWPAVPGCPPPG